MRTSLFLFLCSLIGTTAQEIQEEEIQLFNGVIELPGTLTYPKVDKKLPLALFVHGSGNVDRNGNQGAFIKANYIKLLADSLNQQGIAFYRFDKRTSNPTNFAHLANTSFYDLVADVAIAIQHFKQDTRFNSIHLIGHSQGSLIAMLNAKEGIASYISLAGPGQSFDQALIGQLTQQNEELGKVATDHIAELKKKDTILKVNPNLIQLFAPQNQKFLKEWMLIDPAETLKTLEIPILILQGDSDLQLTLKDANNLKDANPKAQMEVIPQMNHVLKTVKTLQENQESYVKPEYPLSSILVRSLTQFIPSHE